MNRQQRLEKRRIATEWLRKYEENIVCANCGAEKIEWHNEDHPKHPNNRVSSLRAQGVSIDRIKREIDICTPLCRLCHMKEDGRLKELHRNAPQQKGDVIVEKQPCSCCGILYKPLRRGMCSGCYNHHTGKRLRKTMSCDGCCEPN